MVISSRRQKRWARGLAPALALSGLLAAMAIVPSGAAAEQPQLLRSFCPTGQAGGQCIIPRGIGVDEASGETYVADQLNRRIEKFTAGKKCLGEDGLHPGHAGTPYCFDYQAG